MPKPQITGQVIFREVDAPIQNRPGKKLMMVVGIVEVPEDFKFQGEHQYVIAGDTTEKHTKILFHNDGKNVAKQISHMDADQMLLAPIWQI